MDTKDKNFYSLQFLSLADTFLSIKSPVLRILVIAYNKGKNTYRCGFLSSEGNVITSDDIQDIDLDNAYLFASRYGFQLFNSLNIHKMKQKIPRFAARINYGKRYVTIRQYYGSTCYAKYKFSVDTIKELRFLETASSDELEVFITTHIANQIK